MLVSGFEGTWINDEIKDLILNRHVGGVILFERNYENPLQLYELSREMQALAMKATKGIPLFISVDQEGGRVCRLKAPFSDFPFQSCLGKSQSEMLAFRFGQALALELKTVGVNMDYAPVLDVNTNPNNPIIGERALSDSPERVARLGYEIIQGFQKAGVIPVGKHFPGHGDTQADSHLELPYVRKDAAALEREELHPFAYAIDNGLEALMTAHVVYPAWDEKYPATFSTKILQGILREKLGFQGIVMSDDLEMKAVEKHYPFDSIPALGLEAGIDLFLVCHNKDKVAALHHSLLREIESGGALGANAKRSVERIRQLKSAIPHPVVPTDPPDFKIFSDRHRELIEEMETPLEW